MRIYSPAVFLSAIVLATTALVPGSRARSGLLIDIDDLPAVSGTIQNDASVKRARYAVIDFETLPEPSRRRMTARDRAVSLELFPDVRIVAAFERFDANPAGTTWVGHVEGVPMSTVTLVYRDGALTGSIAMPSGHFQIRPAEGTSTSSIFGSRGLHVVSEVDQDALPKEAPPIEIEISEAERAAAEARPLVDSGGTIDLMVVYTETAQTHAGGPAGVINLINLGVSETNTSFINSGVNTRIRLVHTALVPYTETSAFSRSLTDLRLGAGDLSGVPALREQYRADLVMMLVHPTQPDACGIGFLMTSVSTGFNSAAFNVVDSACVSPTFAFAHEIGHNMGIRHDWFVDDGVTPYSYAHGYVNPDQGQRWRTIMAYNDRCTTQGFSCARLLSWANPDNRRNPFCSGRGFTCQPQFWFLPGTPMGVPGGTRANCAEGALDSTACDADDRRALNNTAPTVANFRASLPPNARR
jgi:hypothetical protein